MQDYTPNNIKQKDLSERERRFATQYMIDLNARQAAIRAGYSESTARDACKWIQDENPEKPKLAAYVRARLAARAKREEANAERIMRELIRIALLNPADVIDMRTGEVKPGAKKEDMAAIESICVQKGNNRRTEVRFHSKIKAMELAGKCLGMFADNIKISGAVPVIVDDIGCADPPEEELVGYE